MSTTTKEVAEDLWQQVPATWGAYLRLLKARGERSRPKYTYCEGRLTIVSPGAYHEWSKCRLAGLLELALLLCGVPFQAYGELTLKEGKRKKKGTEPDSCYYLTHLEEMNCREQIKMGEDPPPDLVIEVVATHPVEDSLKVHAVFGVKEVWLVQDQELRILILGDDGNYQSTPLSKLVPFVVVAEFTFWMARTDLPNEYELRREFMKWVSTELVVRHQKKSDN